MDRSNTAFVPRFVSSATSSPPSSLPLFPASSFAASLAAISFALATVPATAGAIDASAQASQASALTVASTVGVVVVGSVETLALSGHAVVVGVESVGDGSVVVLRGASETAAAASLVSIRVAGAVSLAAGTVVEVMTTATGCALMTAGRMIAFVPNEVGRGLIRRSHSTATR